jgi:hypothetical protein
MFKYLCSYDDISTSEVPCTVGINFVHGLMPTDRQGGLTREIMTCRMMPTLPYTTWNSTIFTTLSFLTNAQYVYS